MLTIVHWFYASFFRTHTEGCRSPNPDPNEWVNQENICEWVTATFSDSLLAFFFGICIYVTRCPLVM